MNKIIALLVTIAISYSCTNEETSTISNPDSCESLLDIGSSQICLINMEGMKEVYSNQTVKTHMDASEPASTTVLAVYLTNEKYNTINVSNGIITNSQFVFSDRFKLYMAKKMVDEIQNPLQLESVYNDALNAFSKPENIKELLNSEFKNMEYDTPHLVKSYKLNLNAYSFVTIIKSTFLETGEKSLRVSIVTLMNLNGKSIFSNYIVDYINEESIDLAIEKNNILTTKLLEQNN